MTIKRKPKVFYGYIVVTVSFFILAVIHGMWATYGIFFNPLQAEFGWSRALISGASSLGFFLNGLFAVVAGRLTDRFGPRITMTVSGCVLGLGYFLMSQVNAVWQLFLFYGLLVGTSTGSGDVSLLSTTARWFARRRGMMSGIIKIGTGAGIMILPLVASSLIAGYGWRNSYITLGIVSMVVIVSLAQFLSRDPSQKGLKPYGEREGAVNSSYLVGEGLSPWGAIHTRQLWMICAVYFTIYYSTQTMMVHIAPHAVDLGISAVSAAGIISTIGATSILGRFIMGAAGDRIGNKRALSVCLLVLTSALIWLQFTKDLWRLNLFAGIYGFAHGGFFALLSPLVAESFGMRSHGAILGVVICLGVLGAVVGPFVTGFIFDATRSYQLAFLIMLVVSITGFILSTLLSPIRLKSKSEPKKFSTG